MPERTPYYSDESVTLWHGDSLEVLKSLPDQSVDCCVTSPPYFGLRDYGEAGQYGLEASPAEYVETMRAVFAEVRRVLTDDGTLWLNLGDSYVANSDGYQRGADLRRDKQPKGRARETGGRLPDKNLRGIPWRTAFALQDDGWRLRNDIIWAKANSMPESVLDRMACRHEHVFLMSKSRFYWFDLDPIREPLVRPDAPAGEWVFGGKNKVKNADPIMRRRGTTYTPGEQGRNPGDVWTLATQPFGDAHFAVMPSTLAERCILAGCKPGGTVLDPFSGSGTTGLAAAKHGRRYVGIDLNRDYLDLSLRTRLGQKSLLDGESA